MSEVILKRKIKKKFGTLSAFYRATGLRQYDLQCKSQAEINRIVDRTKATISTGQIPPVKLALLKTAVIASGGVMLFCEKNAQFNDRTLFQILQGRRKRMSPVVTELFNHFRI